MSGISIWPFCEARNFAVHRKPRQGIVTKNLPARFCDSRIINIPTFRIILSGRVPDSSAIEEPHSGQKCLRIGLPLPPMLVNVLSVPSILTASLGTRTSAVKALPVNFGNPGNGTPLRSSGRPRLCNAPRRTGNHL